MASVTHLAWELTQAIGLGFVALPIFATGLFAVARIAETLQPRPVPVRTAPYRGATRR